MGLALGVLLLSQTACTPKIYVVDRQTVLEEEAAGHWPLFEKEVIKATKAAGPTPFAKVSPGPRRARLYNVLNGQMDSTTSKE
jgi:hypothetical protein